VDIESTRKLLANAADTGHDLGKLTMTYPVEGGG
jgi:hypothetical protein